MRPGGGASRNSGGAGACATRNAGGNARRHDDDRAAPRVRATARRTANVAPVAPASADPPASTEKALT